MDIKKIIEEKCNIVVDSIKLIGEGYDSKAYIVNNEYVFKIKFSANKKKGYEKEKAIYDFLNKKLNTNIKIPNIEYSYFFQSLCSFEEFSAFDVFNEFRNIDSYPNLRNGLRVHVPGIVVCAGGNRFRPVPDIIHIDGSRSRDRLESMGF